MVSFDRLLWFPITVLYSNSVFEIFDFKNAVTFKTGKLAWCVKVIENFTIRQRAYDFLLMFYSSLALYRVVSETLNVEKYRDLEILVKGQSS